MRARMRSALAARGGEVAARGEQAAEDGQAAEAHLAGAKAELGVNAWGGTKRCTECRRCR